MLLPEPAFSLIERPLVSRETHLMDFLQASVSAKIINVSTNIAAIALRHGSVFIRKAFLVVVVVRILHFSAAPLLS